MNPRSFSPIIALLLLLGCSDESEPAPVVPVEQPPEEACPPPNRTVGEACIEPGVQDNGCPAGTLGLNDGSCQPAGVPPEMCAEGFVHDGDAGCDPILPPDRCPPGQMAVPGDTACRPVMDCGSGRWGDIPVDSNTVYVDAAYTGGMSDGSEQQPYTTISAAVTAAADDALIAVAAGTYNEDVVVQKRLRIWGVCPELVELLGSVASFAAFIRPGAGGSELRGVAVSGSAAGIGASGVEDLLIDSVWVHDAGARGVDVESVLGATAVTISNSLIEENRDLGIYVSGSQLSLDSVVVRGTLPRLGSGLGGRGMSIQPNSSNGQPANVSVVRSLIENNHSTGVLVSGSEARLAGVVIRGTLPSVADQLSGRGISIQLDSDSLAPASVTLSSSLIDDNHDLGVFVGGSQALLEGVVVRGTRSRASDQQSGGGVGIEPDSFVGEPATATVSASLIEDNHDEGIFIQGSQAVVEATWVRRTKPRASDQLSGFGISILAEEISGAPASVTVSGSRIEESHTVGMAVRASEATIDGVVVQRTRPSPGAPLYVRGIDVAGDSVKGLSAHLSLLSSIVEDNLEGGVFIVGSEAEIEGILVRGTPERPSDAKFGFGVAIALDPVRGTPAIAHIAASQIEDCYEDGVVVAASNVVLSRMVVRNTRARVSNGLFGDGVSVTSAVKLDGSDAVRANVVLRNVRVENSERAGLSNFGADVALESSVLSCNGFQLAGEPAWEEPYTFDDRGGNRCGCPEATGPCVAETSAFAPPETLGEAPE